MHPGAILGVQHVLNEHGIIDSMHRTVARTHQSQSSSATPPVPPRSLMPPPGGAAGAAGVDTMGGMGGMGGSLIRGRSPGRGGAAPASPAMVASARFSRSPMLSAADALPASFADDMLVLNPTATPAAVSAAGGGAGAGHHQLPYTTTHTTVAGGTHVTHAAHGHLLAGTVGTATVTHGGGAGAGAAAGAARGFGGVTVSDVDPLRPVKLAPKATFSAPAPLPVSLSSTSDSDAAASAAYGGGVIPIIGLEAPDGSASTPVSPVVFSPIPITLPLSLNNNNNNNNSNNSSNANAGDSGSGKSSGVLASALTQQSPAMGAAIGRRSRVASPLVNGLSAAGGTYQSKGDSPDLVNAHKVVAGISGLTLSEGPQAATGRARGRSPTRIAPLIANPNANTAVSGISETCEHLQHLDAAQRSEMDPCPECDRVSRTRDRERARSRSLARSAIAGSNSDLSVALSSFLGDAIVPAQSSPTSK